MDARKFNEQLKLFVTSINALGLVVIGAGFIQPLVTGETPVGAARLSSWIWIVIGFALHLAAQTGLRFLRDEEWNG